MYCYLEDDGVQYRLETQPEVSGTRRVAFGHTVMGVANALLCRTSLSTSAIQI